MTPIAKANPILTFINANKDQIVKNWKSTCIARERLGAFTDLTYDFCVIHVKHSDSMEELFCIDVRCHEEYAEIYSGFPIAYNHTSENTGWNLHDLKVSGDICHTCDMCDAKIKVDDYRCNECWDSDLCKDCYMNPSLGSEKHIERHKFTQQYIGELGWNTYDEFQCTMITKLNA